MEIIFATKNKNKIIEIKNIFKDTDFSIISLEEANINVDVVENGATFEENAIKKAVEISKLTGKLVLSDDSGLEIDFFDKKPGVYSARFLGSETPYLEKNKIILEKLSGIPKEKRTARFICIVAACFPDGKVITARGVMEGIINDRIQGENGFGYDPIFYLEEYKKTTAEMTLEEKNKISHRGKALMLMKEKLMKELNL